MRPVIKETFVASCSQLAGHVRAEFTERYPLATRVHLFDAAERQLGVTDQVIKGQSYRVEIHFPSRFL